MLWASSVETPTTVSNLLRVNRITLIRLGCVLMVSDRSVQKALFFIHPATSNQLPKDGIHIYEHFSQFLPTGAGNANNHV